MRRPVILLSTLVFALSVAGAGNCDTGQFRMNRGDWDTNFSKHSIDPSELLAGGPPKDGIPAVNDPDFIPPKKASRWLADNEPVILVEHNGEARAYPLQILIWHEMANDRIGDLPIVVTFCPLCNSSLVFDRRIDGEVHEFGVSGMLRNSDLVMYDRKTDSLWQQLTGEAIVGDYTGKRLKVVTSQVVPFEDFRKQFPDGKVLSRNTGHNRPYGKTPYAGYEGKRGTIFPVKLEAQVPVHPKERLVTLTGNGKSMAFPFSYLRKRQVAEDKIGGEPFVIFYEERGVSALDSERISKSKDIGSVGVFSPVVDGERLKFREKKGNFEDKQTGSTWNLLGRAVDGPMKGKKLKPLQHGVYYAFAWLAFRPDTDVVGVAQSRGRNPAIQPAGQGGPGGPQRPGAGVPGGSPAGGGPGGGFPGGGGSRFP